jgi:hypothetical protein
MWKLKCCLNYELDSYLDALKDFPDMGVKLKTKKGMAICHKQDIFKRQMWFSFEDAPLSWIPVAVDRVNEILEMNKKGEKPESLEDYAEVVEATPDYSNVVGQDSLTRFDKKRSNRGGRRRGRNQQKKRHGNNRNKKK